MLALGVRGTLVEFSLVEFSLSQDNVVVAAGELWRHTGAISMGGSFSAQSADLHSVWCCKLRVDQLWRWGQFSKTNDGIVQWSTGDTTFALQQFRDNLVVASKGLGGGMSCNRYALCLRDLVHESCL